MFTKTLVPAKFTRKMISITATLLVALLVLAVAVRPVSAQTATPDPAPIIVLDNSTPSVDVVVSPDSGASGVVYVEIIGAHLVLKDSNNFDVLSLTDKRVSALAIQLTEGAAPHTLHLERLPGVDQAHVRITAQSALPIINTIPTDKSNVQTVASTDITTAKVTLTPAQTMPISVTDKSNMVSLELSQQESTVQLTDSTGAVLFTAGSTKEVSGLSLRLDPGTYSLNIANKDLNSKSEIELTLSPSPVFNISDKEPANQQSKPVANISSTCSATVNVTSMNLRSGPGTAYTILGNVGQQNKLAVGGVNREGGWLLVKGPNGTAWISATSASLSGSCNTLPTFNIPVKNMVTVSSGGQTQVSAPGSAGQSGDDHHNEQEQHNNNDQHEGGDDGE